MPEWSALGGPDLSVNGDNQRADGAVRQRGRNAFPRGAYKACQPYYRLYDLPGLFVPAFFGRPGCMAHPQFCGAQVCDGLFPDIYPAHGHRPFYKYYQIGGTGEPDEAEAEPKKKGELRTKFEGSHSLFGFVWQVASATGWSVDYILNKVNYQTLIMMLSDAPRYVRVKDDADHDAERSAEDEAGEIVGFYQSKLK